MLNTAIVFGANGGIGQAVNRALGNHFNVIQITRDNIDFNGNCQNEVNELLNGTPATVIVNCTGVLGSNFVSYNSVFDPNVGSNWNLIRYYIDNPPLYPTKLIMVGSSAYRSGRKDYILYAASKAALYNMWQGACEYFDNTNVTLGLVNPVRTRTKMIRNLSIGPTIEPEDVAEEILHLALNMNKHQLVDMNYPKEKK